MLVCVSAVARVPCAEPPRQLTGASEFNAGGFTAMLITTYAVTGVVNIGMLVLLVCRGCKVDETTREPAVEEEIDDDD